MKVLQTITQLSNSEESCPFGIKKCELLYNEKDVRMLLRLTLDISANLYKDIKVDVCCYDKSGFKLSVMEEVPYVDGGMYIEIPSLMAASAAVIIRSAKNEDGIKWWSEAVFSDKVEINDDEYSDTAKFNSLSIDSPDREPSNEEISDIKSPKKEYTRDDKREERRRRYQEEEELRWLIKNDPVEKKKRLVTRIVVAAVVLVVAVGGGFTLKYKSDADSAYKTAMNLYNSGRFEEAKPEFEKTEGYFYTGDKKDELYHAIAMTNARCYDFKKAALYFKMLGEYREGFANYRSIINSYSNILSAGKLHSVAIGQDGKVLTVGVNDKEQCNTDEWLDIINISAGGEHTVGISRNKVVMATGDNSKGQCNVESWKDVVDISAGDFHTAGVLNIGRVVAVGDNVFGQCDVDNWSGVVSVSAGAYHTVGLKLDGTVVATGNNENGECNVAEWENVALVVAGNGFTAGLTGDGRVLFTGKDINNIKSVKGEKNVFSIGAGSYNLYVIYDDGSVKSFGSNDRNQGVTDLWYNVVASDGGENHGIAVSDDGKVYAVGSNEKGQATVSEWSEVFIPKSTVTIRKGE